MEKKKKRICTNFQTVNSSFPEINNNFRQIIGCHKAAAAWAAAMQTSIPGVN